MIKITHIAVCYEKEVFNMLHNYLKKNCETYFEIKRYGNGISHSPTEKLSKKD